MRRPDLVPDCRSCAAVCCVATSFERSDDFALDKPAGVPCPYLTRACHCSIHDQLIERGFRGCAIYDCYGAGQRVTRAFAERRDAEAQRHEAFLVLRVVHELLWLLTEAAQLCPATDASLRAELALEIERLDAIPADVATTDLVPHRAKADALLRRVGAALGGRRALASDRRSP